MAQIVVVEDDLYMREELIDLLNKSGYDTFPISEFEDVVSQIQAIAPDLILLDINLPYKSGFDILGLGADDYLTQTCNMERLLARIKSLLRRTEQQQIQHDLLKGNGFLLDPHTFTIYVGKTSYVLPPNEGKILLTLLMNYPRTVSKEELFHALWGTDKFIDENALQVNFTRLRKTMRNYGLDDRIETVRGEGYRLKEQVDI